MVSPRPTPTRIAMRQAKANAPTVRDARSTQTPRSSAAIDTSGRLQAQQRERVGAERDRVVRAHRRLLCDLTRSRRDLESIQRPATAEAEVEVDGGLDARLRGRDHQADPAGVLVAESVN